jgi:hypothetical protein
MSLTPWWQTPDRPVNAGSHHRGAEANPRLQNDGRIYDLAVRADKPAIPQPKNQIVGSGRRFTSKPANWNARAWDFVLSRLLDKTLK